MTADRASGEERQRGDRRWIGGAADRYPSVGALVKRAFDVVLAAAGLALSWPIWLAVALAIRLEDGGPVFFRQARYGQHGVPFDALKFRSMVATAGSRPAVAALADDPRITRVGRM
ncbi:MAG: sugar transferase, partial [Alphaproteobacteria bacterium]